MEKHPPVVNSELLCPLSSPLVNLLCIYEQAVSLLIRSQIVKPCFHLVRWRYVHDDFFAFDQSFALTVIKNMDMVRIRERGFAHPTY